MARELDSTSTATAADVSHAPAAAGKSAPAAKKLCASVKTFPAGDKTAASMLGFQAKQLLKKSNPNADASDLREHMRQFCFEFEDSDDTLNDLLNNGREWLAKELAKNNRKKGAKKASASKDVDHTHTPLTPAPTVQLSESELLNGPELLKAVAAFLDRFVFFTDRTLYSFLSLWIIATHLYEEFDYFGSPLSKLRFDR
jgi:hypothetical protein